MKKALKYSGILLAIILVASVVAIFFTWRSINANSILNIIAQKRVLLKKNGISTKITELKVYKDFPTLTIQAKSIQINSKKADADIKNTQIVLPILKIAVSKIFGKTYIGKLTSDAIFVNIKPEKQSNKKPFNFKEIELPIIPIDIETKFISINGFNIKAKGKLKENYKLVSNSNITTFEGEINNTAVQLILKTGKKHLTLTATANYLTLKNAKANLPKVYLYYSTDGLLKAKIEAEKLILKQFSIDKPNLEAVLNLNRLPIITVKNLNLDSSNGFKVSLKGSINTKNLKESNIEADISSGYLDIGRFNIPNNIKDYIIAGKIRLSDIKIIGKPSLESVKNGRMYAKSVRFRIDKKSPFFLVKRAEIKITPTFIKAEAKGSFDKIKTPISTFIVYRKKGFPCDMHLNFYGEASEFVRIFLEENIFSKEDLMVLGKTRELSGSVEAKIDVYGYRWAAKPYFNFTVNIFSKGITFKNPNIPNEYVKAYGNLIIKRIVKQSKVSSVFIMFKNFKATTENSTVKTKNLKLIIKPKLAFYGDYDISLSKEDLEDLQKRLLGLKEIFTAKRVILKGNLKGRKDSLNIRTSATVKTENRQIDASFKAFLNYPTIDIYNLKLKGIGNLTLSGEIDLKKEKILLAEAKAKNLDIDSLKEFVHIPKEIGGKITGAVNFKIKNSKPIFKNGNLLIENGRIGAIKDINAIISLKNENLTLKGATFDILSNRITAKGSFNTLSNHIKLKLFADNFTLDFDKIKPSKEKKPSYSFKIPPYGLDISASINNLTVKNKEMVIPIGSTKIDILNNTDILKASLSSKKTIIKINYTKKRNKTLLYVRDRAIWNAITKCNNKNLLMLIKGTFFNKKKDLFDLSTIYGDLIFTAKDGCFNKTPSAIKIFSILNPFESFTKGMVKSRIDYSEFHGNLKLKSGIIEAEENDPIMIKGNLNIFAYGKYEILKSRIDAYITFITFSAINKTISSIPVIGWIIGGKEKSFTGLSFHVKGNINDPKIKPIPFKNLAKGVLGVVKRTLMIPLKIFGVK
ncbi:AsmA-like C-terminal domain-containing protein [Hippea alviniae]|uniref:AsmA-like C-terminal domain-containing protein n=1 Tax=Hippea alviniae TaxID=1279027 RepID=UPI0003B59B52|nr:AsmA-like C-terminal domain-containing protein [Hippea alviniae]